MNRQQKTDAAQANEAGTMNPFCAYFQYNERNDTAGLFRR